MTEVLSVIPARGGSKGVTMKNLRMLGGKPLVAHQIEASLNSSTVNRTIVSTDHEHIATAAQIYGAEVPFERPKELAADDVPAIDVVKHATEYWQEYEDDPDYVLCLQPTSPFTTSTHIESAIEKIEETDSDSVVAVEKVTETHPYRSYRLDGDKVNPVEGVTVEEPHQRQDRPDIYGFTGAIYLRKPELLTEWDRSDFALGDDVRAIVQEDLSTIEIDTPFQLRMARALINYTGSEAKDIWKPKDSTENR